MTRWAPMRPRRLWLAAGVCLAGLWLLYSAASALWQASQTLREENARRAGAGRIPFRAAALGRSAPAGFESFTAPSGFRDATLFRGRLVLGGAAGLTEISPEGTIAAEHRVGLELPPAPITALAAAAGEDGEPELWIATAGEGLLVYDGRAFRHIRPEAPAHRDLSAVLPLATGRVLLGGAKTGVLVYDGAALAPFHPALSGLPVTALAGGDAELWVGTLDRGLLRWRAGEVTRFGEAEGLPDRQVLSLALNGEHAFAGTALGIAEFRGGRFARVLAPGFFARALLVRGDSLAAGSLEEGVIQLPLAARPPRGPRPRAAEASGEIRRLADLGGRLYALTPDALEPLEGGERLPAHPGRPRLADRNISALAADSSGRLWVGFFDRGLQLVDPAGAARHIENQRVYCVNRIVLDDTRGAAVATANGLVLFDAHGNERQTLTRAHGLIADHVTDVILRDGEMVAATPAGITFLDGSGARSLYAFHGLVNNHVYALAASGARVLAGTLGGLSVLDSAAVRASFTTANSALGHNWITALVEAGGDWFVGTYGAGVLRFDAAGLWHRFPELPPGLEINPNAMTATPRAVYAGTLTHGLLVFDRSASRWRQVARGLPSLNVTAAAARGGHLYIGTANGLVRAPEDALSGAPLR